MPQLIASVEGVKIKHFHLEKNRTTLGRKPKNDIVFDNIVVSGEHCAFELKGLADVYVEDMGSTNGTYINGQMLKAKRLLQDGDTISIGNFRIQFIASSQLDPEYADSRSDRSETAPLSIDALGLPGTTGAQQASLKLLSGSSAGLEVPIVKAITTFGQVGVAVVAISHRRDGYYIAQMESQVPSQLNGKPIDSSPVPLAHNDILTLAGTEIEFLLKHR